MALSKQTIVILFIGILLSGAIFFFLWDKQKINWQNNFHTKVQVLNRALLSKFDVNEKVLESFIALFRASKFIDREEFNIFAETIIKNQSYIHALEWIPRVPHDKRQEYEGRAISDGLKGYQISELSDSGKMIRAKKRDFYFPVFYVNPLERNKMALGFDLYSNSTRRKALERSLDSGNVEGTSHISLVQEEKSGPGFLIFYPHYRGNKIPETLEKRRELFEGFVLGVYLIEELIEDILQGGMVPGLNLAIYEGRQIKEGNRLYGNLISHHAMEGIFPINVTGRAWILVWQADEKFRGGLSIVFPLIASGGLFAFIFLLAVIFEMNLIRTKTIEKEVEERTFELKRANIDLTQFADVASHDLKAPLRGISHLTHWIAEDLGDNIPDEVRKNLDRLAQSVKDMDALVRGILEYSVAGKNSSEVQTINISHMVQSIVALFDPREDVEAVIQPDMPIFKTDVIKLKQVFSNLISNAINHNVCPNKKLMISSKRKGSFYEFRVADNGPGINPKHYERIFDMFQTLEADNKGDNTGIGLPIVKKLVEGAHGSIWIEPVKDGGTAFIFSWPVNIENID